MGYLSMMFASSICQQRQYCNYVVVTDEKYSQVDHK